MPATCYVPGCKNRGGEFKFYNIPRGSGPFKRNRRRLWLQAIKGVEWTESKLRNARICNAHFISGKHFSNFSVLPSVSTGWCCNQRHLLKLPGKSGTKEQRSTLAHLALALKVIWLDFIKSAAAGNAFGNASSRLDKGSLMLNEAIVLRLIWPHFMQRERPVCGYPDIRLHSLNLG